MKFPAAGKVIRVANVGALVTPGTVVAYVDKARGLVAQLAQQRERLAYHRGLLDGARQQGDAKAEALQSAKVEERDAQVAKTLRALSSLAVVSERTGEVEAILAHEGETVAAGAPAIRLRATRSRVRFALARMDIERMRRSSLCRVAVEDKVYACSVVESGENDPTLRVDLETTDEALQGKTAYLARASFEQAAVVPESAFAPGGSHNRLIVVGSTGRVEPRTVTVAEGDAKESVVVQGLDNGDRVVIEAPPALTAGTLVRVIGAGAADPDK